MLTAILILLPLLVSGAIVALKPSMAKFIAFATSFLLLVISVVAAFHFDKTVTESQFAVNWPWITSLGINFSVGMDGISLFLFYIFWEVALIPVYFICLVWGGENRGRITLKFFIYTLTGSLLMLVALIYLYYQTPGSHTFAIQSLYLAGHALGESQQVFVFIALFFAFAIKMPVFPF